MQKYTKKKCKAYPSWRGMVQFEDEINIKQHQLKHLFTRSSPVSREKLVDGKVLVTDGTRLRKSSYMLDWVRIGISRKNV